MQHSRPSVPFLALLSSVSLSLTVPASDGVRVDSSVWPLSPLSRSSSGLALFHGKSRSTVPRVASSTIPRALTTPRARCSSSVRCFHENQRLCFFVNDRAKSFLVMRRTKPLRIGLWARSRMTRSPSRALPAFTKPFSQPARQARSAWTPPQRRSSMSCWQAGF